VFGFTKEDIIRYSRQIVLKEVGGKHQKQIRNSSVLVVGVGALGSITSLYLTAAGIGRIGLIDDDTVDLSNLQRQIIYSTEQVGEHKSKAAKLKLNKLNPNVEVIDYVEKLTPSNARKIIRKYDFIIDGSDNFPTKYLVNDASILEKKPFSIAGILRFEGQVMTVLPNRSACYRCVFQEIPDSDFIPSCSQAGVLGPIPGFAASLQSTEVLKYLIGERDLLLINKLFLFDIMNLDFSIIELKMDENCTSCGIEANASLNVSDYSENNGCKLENT